MPDKIDKELKRKFGAYLKVAILNAKKEYLIELNKIIKTETSLDEVDSIEDKAAERMLQKREYVNGMKTGMERYI